MSQDSPRPVTGRFGRRRDVPLTKLQAGMRVTQPIIGRAGRVLVHAGEVLSQKHVDFINELCAKTGEACLLVYQRKVEVQACLASARERPLCDSDPYASIAVQKHYKRGTKLQLPKLRDGYAGDHVQRFVCRNGKLEQVK